MRTLFAIVLLAACGPKVGSPHDQMMAAGKRRMAEGDARKAIADYQAAGSLDANDQALLQSAADQLIADDLAAAEELRAAGDLRGAFLRFANAKVSAQRWGVTTPAQLDTALAAVGAAWLDQVEAGAADHPAAAARDLTTIATRVGDAATTQRANADLVAIRDWFVARAYQASAEVYAADLHLRVARSLGHAPSANEQAAFDVVEESTHLPIRVIDGGDACGDLVTEVARVLGSTTPNTTPLTLELTFRVDRCDVVPGDDNVALVVTGEVTMRVNGETEVVPLESQAGYTGTTSLGDYDRARLRDQIAADLAADARTNLDSVKQNVVATLRERLGSSDWVVRDAAAAALYGIDHAADAASVLFDAYGLDDDVLAALYQGNYAVGAMPGTAALDGVVLPDPDRVVRPDPDDSAESRRYDAVRPIRAGVRFGVRRSPLEYTSLATTVGVELSWLSADLIRDELGGDSGGWQIAIAPQLPRSEHHILQVGLGYGEEHGTTPPATGDGDDDGSGSGPGNLDDRSKWFALRLRSFVPIRRFMFDLGADLNFLQLNGTGARPEHQNFSTASLGMEIPLPLHIYVRPEVGYTFGAPDGVGWGLTVGIRKVRTRKL